MKITDLLNTQPPSEQQSFKPLRKRIAPRQLAILQEIFAAGVHFPDRQLRSQLSGQLQLSGRTIQVWFQNQRQALKARSSGITSAVVILQSLRNSAQ